MNISGQITVAAPRAAVFDKLKDAPFFAACVEGVKDLHEIDATHYDAVLETKVAYLKFSFKVTVEITNLSPPDTIEAKVEGTPIGMVGRLTAATRTHLTEAGGQTVIAYSIDSTLAGKLGSIGQPVLKAKAKEMETKFTERLRAEFSAGETQ